MTSITSSLLMRVGTLTVQVIVDGLNGFVSFRSFRCRRRHTAASSVMGTASVCTITLGDSAALPEPSTSV